LITYVVLGAAYIRVGFAFAPLPPWPIRVLPSNFCSKTDFQRCHGDQLSFGLNILGSKILRASSSSFASSKGKSQFCPGHNCLKNKLSFALSSTVQNKDLSPQISTVQREYLDQIFSFLSANGGKKSLVHIGTSVKRPKELGARKLILMVKEDSRFMLDKKSSILSLKIFAPNEGSEKREDAKATVKTPPVQSPKSKFLDLIYTFISRDGGKKSLTTINAEVKRPKPFSGKLKAIIEADPRFCIDGNMVSIALPGVSLKSENSKKTSPNTSPPKRASLESSARAGRHQTPKLSGAGRHRAPQNSGAGRHQTPLRETNTSNTGSLSEFSHKEIKRDDQKLSFDSTDMVKVKKAAFEPRSPAQVSFMKHLTSDTTAVVVGFGPAGSGKTFIACHMAIQKLMDGSIQKLVLTRPIVAADKDLGFLPGGIREKMHCWMLPIYDTLEKCVGSDTLKRLIESGIVELSPLAYMRGRTFENCWVIGDEFQNCDEDQMRMILTRVGFNCKLVITGDPLQCDLPSKSNGLSDFISRIRNSNFDTTGIALTEFTGIDVQRHAVVRKVLKLYGMLSDSEYEPQSDLFNFDPLEKLEIDAQKRRVEDDEIRFIDDLPKLKALLSELTIDCYSGDSSLSLPALAIDIEGVNLGSKGEVCLIQIVSNKNRQSLYLVDIFSLGSGAFEEDCTFNGRVSGNCAQVCHISAILDWMH
jgi:phosphate starvation-inducible protein PhoH